MARPAVCPAVRRFVLRDVPGAGGMLPERDELSPSLLPPSPALAAPQRYQREARSKTKQKSKKRRKRSPGGGVPRKEGTAVGEVRGGETEGGRYEGGKAG